MTFEDATGAPWSGGSDLFQCRDQRRTAHMTALSSETYRQNTLTGWLGRSEKCCLMTGRRLYDAEKVAALTQEKFEGQRHRNSWNFLILSPVARPKMLKHLRGHQNWSIRVT